MENLLFRGFHSDFSGYSVNCSKVSRCLESHQAVLYGLLRPLELFVDEIVVIQLQKVISNIEILAKSPKMRNNAKTRYCGHHLPRLSRDVSQQDQTTCLFHHMGEGQMGAHSGGVPLSTIHWALLGTINMGYIHEIYWANTYNINRAKSAIYME